MVFLLAAGVSACGQATVTPVASGPGWTLLRTATPTQVKDGLAIAPLGDDQVLVSATVPAGGTNCGAPTFAGFATAETTTLAKISRSPWDASCAYISSTTYFIALDRTTIPAGVTAMAISDDWCTTPDRVCDAVPIPS